MNVFFLDASGLAKRYTLESGADRIDHLFSTLPRARLLCLMLGAAEVVSVLVRRRNGGLLAPATCAQGLDNLRTEIVEDDDFNALDIGNDLIVTSLPLIDKHSINSNDAVALRLCLDLAVEFRKEGNDLVLVTSDKRLLKAALAEGLLTFNPETQTQAELDVLLAP